jgi:hypothetical protein
MSPNATSRQLHVSLAENHRCDPVVRLRITSGLSVIQAQRLRDKQSGPDSLGADSPVPRWTRPSKPRITNAGHGE